jgi:hypothetical protein
MPVPIASMQLALRAVRLLNILYLAGILVLLLASIVAADWTFAALGVAPGTQNFRMVSAMRTIMLVGIAGAVVAHIVLSHLLAIVESVRHGDPFVLANAQRLQAIAWWVLSGELLHFVVVALASVAASSGQPLDIDWTFSLTPWIAVVMLFVLARVFEHGARLRADLEGTV